MARQDRARGTQWRQSTDSPAVPPQTSSHELLASQLGQGWENWQCGCVSKCCVPLFTQINPMVLLIIIQFLNGYLFGNIAYFQTNPHDWCNWKWDKENLVMSVSIQSSCLKNKGTWHTTPFPMTAIPKITPNCRTLRWKINSISTETWPKGSDPAPAFSIWEGLRGWLFRFESQSSENPKADWWF